MTEANGSADAGNPAGNPAPWYGANAPDDIKGFVELKGWSEPSTAIESYRNLEKLLGADKAGRAVVWPKDDNDSDGWAAINAKLGVPQDANGYKLPIPEGDDGSFAKSIAPLLHQAGLSSRQAEKLATAWNEMSAAQQSEINGRIEQQVKDDQAVLAKEWGAAAQQKSELAKRAAVTAGLTEDDVADMIAAMGYAKTQKMLAQFGERMGEDSFAGADGRPSGGVLTPAAARAKLDLLMGDQDWLNKFASGDVKAIEEKDRLDSAILGMSLEQFRASLGRAA